MLVERVTSQARTTGSSISSLWMMGLCTHTVDAHSTLVRACSRFQMLPHHSRPRSLWRILEMSG